MRRHARVAASHLHRGPAAHPAHRVGRGLGEAYRHPAYLVDGQTGLLRRPLGGLVLELDVPPLHESVRVLLHEGGSLGRLPVDRCGELLGDFRASLEALDGRLLVEVANERSVPQALRQDDVRHGNRERPVLAGLDRHPFVGLRGGRGEPRVDDRDRRPVDCVTPDAQVVGDLPVRGEGVGAPEQHVSRVLHVVLPVSPHPLGVVGAELLRLRADRAVRDVVGGADDLRHAVVEDIAHVCIAAAHEQVLVRLAVLAQLHDLVGDRAQRLVPSDGDEPGVLIPALLRVRPLHRGLEPVGVVGLLEGKVHLRAGVHAVYLGVPVSSDLDGPAVHNVCLGRAP